MNPIKYSICITNLNTVNTLTKSLESILQQVNPEFEVIVVDSKSKDGSFEILMDYQQKGRIKLISIKCSRGIGRQIALANAKGKYIISGLDMDDMFNSSMESLLSFYHAKAEGLVLLGAGESTMIAPRSLLLELGGWRDLQFRENWELCRRAAMRGLYRWTIFPLVADSNIHEERKQFFNRLKYRYIRYRENLRVGHKIFDDGEKTNYSQKLVLMFAMLSSLFKENYRTEFKFKSIDRKYFLDSREYWPSQYAKDKAESLYRLLLAI